MPRHAQEYDTALSTTIERNSELRAKVFQLQDLLNDARDMHAKEAFTDTDLDVARPVEETASRSVLRALLTPKLFFFRSRYHCGKST